MEISCSDNAIAIHPGHFVKWPHIQDPPSRLMYSLEMFYKIYSQMPRCCFALSRYRDTLRCAGYVKFNWMHMSVCLFQCGDEKYLKWEPFIILTVYIVRGFYSNEGIRPSVLNTCCGESRLKHAWRLSRELGRAR